MNFIKDIQNIEKTINFFMFNGLKVNRWKTLETNDMNVYIIMLKTMDKE